MTLDFPGLVRSVQSTKDGDPASIKYLLNDARRNPIVDVGYNLVERDGHFEVWQGTGRGTASPATGDDGMTGLTFPTEAAACEWILSEIRWWQDLETRRRNRE